MLAVNPVLARPEAGRSPVSWEVSKMAQQEDFEKVVAVCTDCGSVYPARKWSNGDFHIIGRNGCLCGASQFTTVETPIGEPPDVETSTD